MRQYASSWCEHEGDRGVFRKRVLDFEPVCQITGLATPTLLIASHIKPWRACGTPAERLDGANGLMLAPPRRLSV